MGWNPGIGLKATLRSVGLPEELRYKLGVLGLAGMRKSVVVGVSEWKMLTPVVVVLDKGRYRLFQFMGLPNRA